MNKYYLVVLITLTNLSATVLNVPGDYATIQAGINASVEGDTVLVAQGNYVENLILEKEIVLASYAIYDELDSTWLSSDYIHSTIIGINVVLASVSLLHRTSIALYSLALALFSISLP